MLRGGFVFGMMPVNCMAYCFFDGENPLHLSSGTILPRWLSPEHPDAFRLRRARRYEHLMDFCRQHQPRKLVFHRTYALGDVVMLVPVLRVLRRTLGISAPIMLVTGFLPWRALGGQDSREPDVRIIRGHGRQNYGGDVHMDLDSCLEADHRPGSWQTELHRCDIYARTLGLI